MDRYNKNLLKAKCFHQEGRILQAIKVYKKILRLDGFNAEVLYLISNAYFDLKKFEKALYYLADYVKIISNNPLIYLNMSTLSGLINEYEKAVSYCDQAILLKPDFAEAYCNRGNALYLLNKFDEALDSCNRAIELKKDYAEAYYNRGNALYELKYFYEALESYDKAISIKSEYLEAYSNRGNVLKELNRFDEAVESYDKAIAIKPEYAEAYVNKSLLLISLGHYMEGWKLYEWRQAKSNHKKYYNYTDKSFWKGNESIKNKKLLIYSEIGIGDTICFSRYIPMICDLGARVYVETPERLLPFLRSLKCPANFFPKSAYLPEFDYCCPDMSFPYIFNTTLENIPKTIPYLFSEPLKVELWKQRLGPKRKLRIGIAWSGSQTHEAYNIKRNISLKIFLGLIDHSLEWHSLQIEYSPEDREFLNLHPEIIQHYDQQNDFSDCAALIECMDLVISIDSSILHVAGALGKPVWVLLPTFPYFLWMNEGEKSPWYPSARLFRQTTIGDWTSVIERVKNELKKLIQ